MQTITFRPTPATAFTSFSYSVEHRHIYETRAVRSHDDTRTAEPVTIGGWYALATPTGDDCTRALFVWKSDGFPACVRLGRPGRELTSAELRRHDMLAPEAQDDYLATLPS